jgi:hypothetical protein
VAKRQTLRAHYDQLNEQMLGSRVEEYQAPKRSDYPECPEFPANLTIVAYKKLGKLYSNYTAFLAFLNEQIAEAKFEVARLNIRRRRRRAAIIFSSGGIKMQKAAAVQRDAEYADLTVELLGKTATLNAYHSMMWTLKDFLKAIDYETNRRAQAGRADGG